jgi:Acyl carrier protein
VTEWVQLSGRAKVLELYVPTAMTSKPAYKDLEPYAYAWIELEEGPERNVMLRNVTKENAEYVRSHLPYPCHLDVVQRDGFKTCVAAIDLIDGEGRLILKASNVAAGKPAAEVPKAEEDSLVGELGGGGDVPSANDEIMALLGVGAAAAAEAPAEEAPAEETAPAEEAKAPAAAGEDSETLRIIKELIAETYKLDANALTAESSFQTDINGPSVMFLGVTARLEDIFDIMLSMTEASSAKNLGELAELVDSLREE